VCYVKAEKPAHIYLELIPKEEREWTPIGFKAGGSETMGGEKTRKKRSVTRVRISIHNCVL
jgi:hypothetical protein